MKISFDILVPIFLMILSGVALRYFGILDEHSVRRINAATFQFFLPVMMFNSIYKSSLSVIRWEFILFIFAAITLSFAIDFVLVSLIEKDNSKRGVLIQAMTRSNFAIYGYAVASAFCTQEESGITAIVSAVALPLFGIYSTVALSVFGERKGKPDIRKIFRDIVRNPLVLGGVFGVLVLLIGIKFPETVESTMESVGKAATPVSLIGLGGFLTKGMMEGRKKAILFGVFGKLILTPALFLTAAVLLGFRGAELAISLAVFATPTATASFAMTQQMEGDDKLAAALIVASCLCSFVTMFVFITVLHSMELL